MSLYFHHILELYNVQVSLNFTNQLCTYFIMFRVKDNKNILFIHLNLCIALALGLVLFIGGIENATITEVPIFSMKIYWL